MSVRHEGGMDTWSGLLDMALDAGCISQSGAWYQLVDLESGEVQDKKYRSKDFCTSFFLLSTNDPYSICTVVHASTPRNDFSGEHTL